MLRQCERRQAACRSIIRLGGLPKGAGFVSVPCSPVLRSGKARCRAIECLQKACGAGSKSQAARLTRALHAGRGHGNMVAVGLRQYRRRALQHWGRVGPNMARLTAGRERRAGCGTRHQLRPESFAVGERVANMSISELATTEQDRAAKVVAPCPQLATVSIHE